MNTEMNIEKMIKIVKTRQALFSTDADSDRGLAILSAARDALLAFERLYPALQAQAFEALAGPREDREIGLAIRLNQRKREYMLNLTQHPATEDQIKAGVVDLPAEIRRDLENYLNFNAAQLVAEDDYAPDLIEYRAQAITALAAEQFATGNYGDDPTVMIGGAPWLMGPLERSLASAGMGVAYAVSDRVSVETVQPDGTVAKSSVFKHVGFVQSVYPEPKNDLLNEDDDNSPR